MFFRLYFILGTSTNFGRALDSQFYHERPILITRRMATSWRSQENAPGWIPTVKQWCSTLHAGMISSSNRTPGSVLPRALDSIKLACVAGALDTSYVQLTAKAADVIFCQNQVQDYLPTTKCIRVLEALHRTTPRVFENATWYGMGDGFSTSSSGCGYRLRKVLLEERTSLIVSL